MNWPATREDLRLAGYVDANRSTQCTCGEFVFWFTTRHEESVPLAIDDNGRWVPHGADCRDAKFRIKLERKKRAARQGVLFQ